MRTLLFILLAAVPVSAAKIVLVVGSTPEEKIITPFGCDFDSKGRLYFVEMEKGERLRAVDDGKVVTLAGTGAKGNSGDGGPALKATFNGMHGLAIGHDDTVYLADTWNNRVRGYKDGKVFAVMGSGTKGKGLAEGAPLVASFGGVFGITTDPTRHAIIITDLDNRRVYGFDPKGEKGPVHIAGNGQKGVPHDGGINRDEPLFDPRAAAVDPKGNGYILERGGHSLRRAGNDKIIRTVVGTGKAGTAVGKALETQMNGPKHCCCDKDGNVYIADAENHRILKYIPGEEKVVLVAGTGKKGANGLDGDPLKCELNRPHGVTVHPKTGELYICDSYNDRILKIVP